MHFLPKLRAILVSLAAFAVSASAADDALPTLWLIGDSTVNNGSGKGDGRLWGWGAPLAGYFDSAKIRVVNRASGGRSSRTFLTEGLWEKVAAEITPGDFVLMQFGHNDGGALTGPKGRASLKGNGDETQEVTPDGSAKKETVHSYGWYLRKYIADAKAKGATLVVLSQIPRNIWKNEKVSRAAGGYGKWAKEAAAAGGALFLDLNEIVAARYETEGEEKVKTEYFTEKDHTHTTAAGARVNATAVVEGIKSRKDFPLASFLAATPVEWKP
ncbi:MAG: rhamnogalacturonan acetylesterase [Chthoniobacteraceae bacterium]